MLPQVGGYRLPSAVERIVRRITTSGLVAVGGASASALAFSITHADIDNVRGTRSDVQLLGLSPGYLVRVDPSGAASTVEIVCHYEDAESSAFSDIPTRKVYYNVYGEAMPVNVLVNSILPERWEMPTSIELREDVSGLRLNHGRQIAEPCLRETIDAVEEDVVCVVDHIYRADDGASIAARFNSRAISFANDRLSCPLHNEPGLAWRLTRKPMIAVRSPEDTDESDAG